MGKNIIRFIAYALVAALFLFGVIIFVYPLLSGYMSEHNSAVYIQDFENAKEYLTEKEQSDSDSANQDDSANHKQGSGTLDRLYEKMQQYNANIYETHQAGLCDAWAYEQSSVDLSEFGIDNSAVAVLRVPRMGNLEMPIFLGASRNNMSLGAAQLGETSMPIGGINTNCVLAGHRGWSGARYFLDIEQMQLGDMVYIENYWETLSYKVTDIQVIYPDDIQKVLIQDGKDMVTLFTCHPYWASTYRYAVFCERFYEEDKHPETVSTVPAQNAIEDPHQTDDAIEVDESSQTRIFLERASYVIIPIILIVLSIILAAIRRRKE